MGAGVVESRTRVAALKAIHKAWGGSKPPEKVGKPTENEVLEIAEMGVCQILTDLAYAMGPRGIIVMEDFILHYGEQATHGTSGREGLSPVRIAARCHTLMALSGVFDGDAWRRWGGHGWGQYDPRGWKVEDGVVPPLWERLQAVEQWRLGNQEEALHPQVYWRGGGCKWTTQIPSQRTKFKTVAQMKDWMRESGLWLTGVKYTHAMDALMHLIVLASKLNADVTTRPEGLFQGSGNPNGIKVSAKRTKRFEE